MENSTINMLFFAAVALPVAGAIVGLFGKNSKAVNLAVQVMNIVAGLAAFAGAGAFLLLQGRGVLSLDGAGQLLLLSGAAVVDGLSAFFLLIVGLGVALISWYSISYLPRYRDTYRFPWLHAAAGLFISGMIATTLAGNALVFLFAWEVMSFAAYFLVIADREPASVKAGFSYIVMTQLGAACMIIGFALFSKGDLLASFASLNGGFSPAVGLIAFSLVFIGFAAKAGVFPLHEWLPLAHPQAPSNASALMSGVMLKVALYGLMRVVTTIVRFDLPFWVGLAIILLGLFSGIFGALKAATETDIKKTLAWSSVENLGLMFAMTGTVVFLVNIGAYGAASVIWIALFIHALNHAIFKSGLFMAAGAIVSETHTRDADKLGGLANKWPFFSKLFLALALAAAALPPLGTFYGEWLFLQTLASGIATSGILTGLILAVIVSAFALAAGLAVFAFVKLFSGVFLSKPRSEHAEHVQKLPLGLVAPVAASVAFSLFLGVCLPLAMKGIWPDANGMLYAGTAVNAGDISISPLLVALFIFGAIAVAWFIRRFFMRAGAVKTDTWDCGAPLTSRMEYTPYAFAAPIRFFFRGLTLPWKKMTTTPVSAENPWIVSRSLEHGETALAERYAYGPVGKVIEYVSLKVKRLQNGVVQFYIALIFIALIVTLIVAL